tara:strand:- start:9572 stop:9916 length:345 start_codon:yes stop_codon:yes gene_type:complete
MDFKEYLIEANIDAFKTKWKDQGLKVAITNSTDSIILNKIIVPKDKRNEGTGTRFIKDLIRFAKKANKRIELTPTNDFGGAKGRLVKFYKSFGFIDNKGKNKNYEINNTMYLEV